MPHDQPASDLQLAVRSEPATTGQQPNKVTSRGEDVMAKPPREWGHYIADHNFFLIKKYFINFNYVFRTWLLHMPNTQSYLCVDQVQK